MENNKLVIKGVKLLFIEVKDKDFGSSIVIDATEPTIKKTIEDYCAAISYSPKFKDYAQKDGSTTTQFAVKISKYIRVQDQDGNDYDLDGLETNLRNIKLAYGATISFVASPYNYKNKFGEGTSLAVSAIKVEKGAEIKDDMSLLA